MDLFIMLVCCFVGICAGCVGTLAYVMACEDARMFKMAAELDLLR